jgi:hypothetical protein
MVVLYQINLGLSFLVGLDYFNLFGIEV